MKIFLERHLYRPALVTPMLLLLSEMASLEFSFFDAARVVASKGVQFTMDAASRRRLLNKSRFQSRHTMSRASLRQ
jgi:hypothetical protein